MRKNKKGSSRLSKSLRNLSILILIATASAPGPNAQGAPSSSSACPVGLIGALRRIARVFVGGTLQGRAYFEDRVRELELSPNADLIAVFLSSPDADMRGRGLGAVSFIHSNKKRLMLIKRGLSDKEASVRIIAAKQFPHLDAGPDRDLLIALALKDRDHNVRFQATAFSLSQNGS